MVENQPLYVEGLDDSEKGSKACYVGGKSSALSGLDD